MIPVAAAAVLSFAIWWAVLGSIGAVYLVWRERRDDARLRRLRAEQAESARQARAAAGWDYLNLIDRDLTTPCTCTRCARLPVEQRGH